MPFLLHQSESRYSNFSHHRWRFFFQKFFRVKNETFHFYLLLLIFREIRGSKPALIVTKERGRKERKKEKSGATKKKRFSSSSFVFWVVRNLDFFKSKKSFPRKISRRGREKQRRRRCCNLGRFSRESLETRRVNFSGGGVGESVKTKMSECDGVQKSATATTAAKTMQLQPKKHQNSQKYTPVAASILTKKWTFSLWLTRSYAHLDHVVLVQRPQGLGRRIGGLRRVLQQADRLLAVRAKRAHGETVVGKIH